MRTRTWIAGVATLTVLAATGACNTAGVAGAAGDRVKVAAVSAGPFTRQFNPLLIGSQNSSGNAGQAIYEPLMMDDLAKQVNRPWLVTSFAWSDGGHTLTLKIRQGVKWSDGKPMTAEDVAYTFDLIRQNKGLNTGGLPLAGASAPSPDTAAIRFTEPAYQVMWWRTTPVPKHLWSSVSDPVKYANPNPVGTGPYAFKSFTPQAITLQKNPYYWQSGMPSLKTVQYISFDSNTSMIAALQSAEVDWISPSTTDVKAVTRGQTSKIGYWVTKSSNAMIFLLPNGAMYPTNQAPVRKAISQALDRTEINNVALGGQNEVAESPTGLDLGSRGGTIAPQYRGLRYGAADPAAARQALTAAGYTQGKDGIFVTPQGKRLSLTLNLPTTSPYGDWVRVSRVLTTQLRKAGIALNTTTESQVAWRNDTELGRFQLTMRSTGGTLSTFDLFDRIFAQPISPVGTKTQRNYERYTSAEAGTLLNTYANASPGSPAEQKALAGLETIQVNEVPAVPLFFTAGVGMWRTDRFTGWPSQNDPYSVSVANSPNVELVLMRLRAKGH